MTEKLRRLARSGLLDFVVFTYSAYRPGWFHRQLAGVLDQFLADVERGRRPRLIVQAPPQHGKSELVSRRLPAYALGLNPDLSIIATSHTAELAERFSTELQRIMDSEDYNGLFPQTRIVGRFAKAGEATRQAGLFDVAGRRGLYRACGVGGAITGMRADILIVDDPIKNDAEANSRLHRDNAWDWFTSTAYTRLSEGGGIIVIMTRWHEDDLVGRLLAAQEHGTGDKWKLVTYPAIAEEDDVHRRQGEALSQERFSLQALETIRRTIGPYKWAALYQQHPTPPEGGIIKRNWIQYYTTLPDCFDELVQSWDLSFKDNRGCDFVAGHVWGRKGSQFFLIDRVHGRYDFPTTLAAVESLSTKWPQGTAKLVEDAANGPAVIAMLRSQVPGLIAVPPEGSKESRVHAVSALFEAHNVFVPDPALASWVHDVVSEWTNFPNGRHDDDCDAMTQALRRLQRGLQYDAPPLFEIVRRPIPGLPYNPAPSFPKEASRKLAEGEPLTDQDYDEILFGNWEEL